jgi:tRNA-splicing ligase RtcB
MGATANFAWCNRQVITHFVREAFKSVFPGRELKLDLIYDVAHNIAKLEKHVIDGVEKEYIVHRKGATRSFGPGRAEIPERYRDIGQPVLVGGSLGTASYILIGTETSMDRAFGSTCHGAGRVLSRHKALSTLDPNQVQLDLSSKGIVLKAANQKTVIEEAPETYKEIEQVVETCETVGISRRVARLVPLGVVKG